jgi:hypothetical protein
MTIAGAHFGSAQGNSSVTFNGVVEDVWRFCRRARRFRTASRHVLNLGRNVVHYQNRGTS